MTKKEYLALSNYSKHLLSMKNYFVEQANKTGFEWYKEKVEEYWDLWLASCNMLNILTDKETMKFWADMEEEK